jgi:uncharacterized protein (TIGR02118 family)
MFKAVILLTRSNEATRESFREWWLQRHAPLARELPGVRRLVFNVIETDGAGFDGVSELWFDSREAFEAAYTTEIGVRVTADTLANVSGRVRLFVEEHVLVG